MRIARLLIYEGTEEDLKKHFAHCFIQPGMVFMPARGNSIEEDFSVGAGGRVELQPGELAAIKVIK